MTTRKEFLKAVKGLNEATSIRAIGKVMSKQAGKASSQGDLSAKATEGPTQDGLNFWVLTFPLDKAPSLRITYYRNITVSKGGRYYKLETGEEYEFSHLKGERQRVDHKDLAIQAVTTHYSIPIIDNVLAGRSGQFLRDASSQNRFLRFLYYYPDTERGKSDMDQLIQEFCWDNEIDPVPAQRFIKVEGNR